MQNVITDLDMDLESLKTKVTEAGATQFSALSDRTIDHFLTREIARNAEDEYYTTEVVEALVKDLKEMDGNVHFEVGKRNTEYRTQFEKKWKEEHPDTKPTEKDDALQKILDRMEAQEKELKDLKEARKQESIKAEKDKVFDSVKKSLKNKFAQAGVEVNDYILRQTLRDLEIPETNANVSELAKSMESAYYKNLKDAGLGGGSPRYSGGGGGGNGKTDADEFWARKAKKEGWKK